jgi:V8-like Glu-specific endopeptidase
MPRVLEALRQRAEARRAAAPETTGEGAPDEYAMLLEEICGLEDDSQPVEQYNGALGVTTGFVATHQSAVGQLQWNDNLASIYTNPGDVSGRRWCSGTMISNDLFLTAGHCFDQTGGGWQRPRVNGTSNIISSAEIAQNMHVNFNYQNDPLGNLRAETSFAVTQLVECRLGGIDFAIIRLAGNPGVTWGRATISRTDAVAGQMLCIIGHPAGMPKRIEAGPALAPVGNLIRYDDIDTLGGNSGSGVLRANDGRIVGVHTNGGCGPSSPNASDANLGQRIAAVIAASPTLQALTAPTMKVADDLHTTLKGNDDHTTVKFTDDLGTSVAADLHTTLKGNDDHTTVKFTDDLGTSVAADLRAGGTTLKFRDDMKHPGLDKSPPGDTKMRGFDGRPQFDRPRRRTAVNSFNAPPQHGLDGRGRVTGTWCCRV